MRTIFIGAALVLVAATATSDNVAQLAERAVEDNIGYQIAVAEHELLTLRYQSDLETAKTADDRANAELSRLSALSTHRSDLNSFYNDVVDAVFDMAIARIELEAAQIRMEISDTDLAYARARHESGVISRSDLTEAELSHREVQNSLAQAQFEVAEAEGFLSVTTGLTWNESLLPGEPDHPAGSGAAGWVETDVSYRRAVISKELAQRAADNPAGTISEYDQQAVEVELMAADLAVREARESAEREYRQVMRTLDSDLVTLEIRRERHALQNQLLTDAEIRLERGLITESTRDSRRVQVLIARSSYLDALRRYIRDVVGYLIHLGEPLSKL